MQRLSGPAPCKDHWAHRGLLQSPDPINKRPRSGAFSIRLSSGSVEQLLEKRFLPLRVAVLMTMSIGLSIAPIVALIILRLCKRRLRHWSRRRRILCASLEDLVEFPAVEPNPAALRAKVNLDALSL